MPWGGVWWNFSLLQFDLCILMQWECKNEPDIDRSDRRILPADCFGGAKRRGPTKIIIQNKAGKKSTFLLSLYFGSKGFSSSCCYWGLRSWIIAFLAAKWIWEDKTWCFWEDASLVCCWHWRLWAAADLPIHLELLSHLFCGDAVEYESLLWWQRSGG